ncbi:hypothetical protein GQ457_11G031080 [Hibiscus cannabinus]
MEKPLRKESLYPMLELKRVGDYEVLKNAGFLFFICSDAFSTGTRVSISVRVLQKLAVVIFASGVQFLETLVPVQESGYRYGPSENTILDI